MPISARDKNNKTPAKERLQNEKDPMMLYGHL